MKLEVDTKAIEGHAAKIVIQDEVRLLALIVAMSKHLEGVVAMPYHVRQEYLWAIDRLCPKVSR